MSDDPGFDGIEDMSELLIPQEQDHKTGVEDSFKFNVGFNFAFAGVGQCGGRIAQSFHQLGYRRVCAINTTIADMRPLKLEEERKLDLGEAQGAGKDPQIAKALFAGRDEDIYDLFLRNWGDDVDHAFICFASAGGTGAGGYPKVVEVARRFMAAKRKAPRVGAIIALPKNEEGQKFAKNCLHTMRSLIDMGLSPVVFIDNQKIRDLYHPSAGEEHHRENMTTATNIHMFNRLSGTDSEHTTFDRQDLAKLLDSGVITFAAAGIEQWKDAADISTPIRDRLRGNVLATVDVSKANVAGLIYVLNGSAYDEVKAEHLDHGTAMFTRMLAKDSTIFPGVYRGSNTSSSITVMAMIGALPWPRDRLNQLAVEAGVPKDTVAELLGV
jgi:cell division GTPase FtsZ